MRPFLKRAPYLYLHGVEAVPEPDIAMRVDGGGAKAGAVAWLRRAAPDWRDGPPDVPKRIPVFTLAEFLAWANRTFR